MNMKKIGIINLGFSNLGSISNLIIHLGKKAELINDFSNLKKFSHIILPGIGSFKEASKIIKKKKLKKSLNVFLKQNGKIFGICLGMQLMFESSTEHGKSKGLGLLKGKCSKFKSSNLKIPHVGFNQVVFPDTAIWSGIDKNCSFYFVHMYRLKKVEPNVRCGYTTYGEKFVSFVEKKM